MHVHYTYISGQRKRQTHICRRMPRNLLACTCSFCTQKSRLSCVIIYVVFKKLQTAFSGPLFRVFGLGWKLYSNVQCLHHNVYNDRSKVFFIYFWQAGVCWPLFCLCRPFVVFGDILIRTQRADTKIIIPRWKVISLSVFRESNLKTNSFFQLCLRGAPLTCPPEKKEC